METLVDPFERLTISVRNRNMDEFESQSPRSKIMRPSVAVIIAVMIGLSSSCSAVQPIGDDRTPGYLMLDVEPTDAEIYVDDDYKGQVDGWRAQTIPLSPGARRLEFRAKGYMTQRFDIEIEPGDQLTLRLRLERELDELDLDKTDLDKTDFDKTGQ